MLRLKMKVSKQKKKNGNLLFQGGLHFQAEASGKKPSDNFLGPTDLEASVGWKEEGPSQKGWTAGGGLPAWN